MDPREAEMQIFRQLLDIAGLAEEETAELIRSAGVEGPVSPESQDFPSWGLEMAPGASEQQRARTYRLAQANAMIRIALSRKRQVAAAGN